jgi:hypothetical protein
MPPLEVAMFYLVSSNGYTTSSIHLQTLGQATEAYLALRNLPTFRDAVWTLRTEQQWLHDHANGVGKPDWWYEVAPDLYAPYHDGRLSATGVRDRQRPAERRSGQRAKSGVRAPNFAALQSAAAMV